MPKILHSLLPKSLHFWLPFTAGLPELSLRKSSLVPAPTPLSRLRDFHFIDSAQKDSASFLLEVAETFVCAPIKRPERQWPLPNDRHCPQTFLFGQSGIRQPVFVWSSIQPKPASRMLLLMLLLLVLVLTARPAVKPFFLRKSSK